MALDQRQRGALASGDVLEGRAPRSRSTPTSTASRPATASTASSTAARPSTSATRTSTRSTSRPTRCRSSTTATWSGRSRSRPACPASPPARASRSSSRRIATKRMNSETIGIDPNSALGYNINNVEYAMRLTYSGEFLHAAPWSVASQGHANVSHGCTGMSTANAAWLYDHSQIGDVVEYTGTSMHMTLDQRLRRLERVVQDLRARAPPSTDAESARRRTAQTQTRRVGAKRRQEITPSRPMTTRRSGRFSTGRVARGLNRVIAGHIRVMMNPTSAVPRRPVLPSRSTAPSPRPGRRPKGSTLAGSGPGCASGLLRLARARCPARRAAPRLPGSAASRACASSSRSMPS